MFIRWSVSAGATCRASGAACEGASASPRRTPQRHPRAATPTRPAAERPRSGQPGTTDSPRRLKVRPASRRPVQGSPDALAAREGPYLQRRPMRPPQGGEDGHRPQAPHVPHPRTPRRGRARRRARWSARTSKDWKQQVIPRVEPQGDMRGQEPAQGRDRRPLPSDTVRVLVPAQGRADREEDLDVADAAVQPGQLAVEGREDEVRADEEGVCATAGSAGRRSCSAAGPSAPCPRLAIT